MYQDGWSCDNNRPHQDIISKLIDTDISLIPSFSYTKRLSLLSNVSDADLITIFLNLLIISKADNIKSYSTVYHILSRECVKRSKYYSVNQILLLSDIWYNINTIAPVSYNYCHFAVNVLFSKLNILNTSQCVQSFFYLNLCRNFKFGAKHSKIEEKIRIIMNEIDIEELGIISMGLFKTRNFIYDKETLHQFTQKLIDNKNIVSSVSLCSLLKVLRKSFNVLLEDHVRLCSEVMIELHPEVERMSKFTLMQLSSLGSNLNLYNTALLNSIFDKFMNNIHYARIKEIERHAFSLMNSKLRNHTLISVMQDELNKPNRQAEIELYKDSFLSCVYYLTSVNQYDENLISKALKLNSSPNFQKRPYRDRHLYELDQMVEILYKENYEGYRLSKQLANSLAKKCLPRMPTWTNSTVSQQEREFLEFQDIILKVLGDDSATTSFILPFSSFPDVIFCSNEMGNLVKFPSEAFKYNCHELKYAPQSNLIWHAVIFLNKISFLSNSNSLRGLMERDIRLKKALGYNIIKISKPIPKEGCKEYETEAVLKVLEKYINTESLLASKSSIANC
ncbi:FAST kinase domain-containing protein 5, mitochondrial [Armadillidium nasatum]|uniref:FAST kinase domain-containing protein 5, mitochondrial n=1 Tax=Armadillidium nasatum TaxID=96803 RepID=A0A5N5SST2_9CRUS|nr:FAST kinase domain-containing protein 5, mitochondrial [Armadillidium nasatum]